MLKPDDFDFHYTPDSHWQWVYGSGDKARTGALRELVLEHERPRVMKDRKWFLPFGFDTL